MNLLSCSLLLAGLQPLHAQTLRAPVEDALPSAPLTLSPLAVSQPSPALSPLQSLTLPSLSLQPLGLSSMGSAASAASRPAVRASAAPRSEASMLDKLRALPDGLQANERGRGRKTPASSSEKASADAGRAFDQTGKAPGAAVSVPAGETFSLPVRTFKLKNGLTVVVQTDESSPMVGVNLTYRVGSQDERPGLSGFAHLFEHLMAQGTKSIQPRELSMLIESRGGIRNASTWNSNTNYHSLVPKSALSLVLWAEAERMHTLNVDARALALEQQVVLEEMRRTYLNQPYVQAKDEAMAKAAFTKWENTHPVIGSKEDVRGASLEDVRAFYKAHYAPNNAVLALAGNVTLSEAKRLAEKYFGSIPSAPTLPEPDLAEPPLRGTTKVTVPDPLAKLPRLFVGWRAPERGSKDFWALSLLASHLSGQDENPLYQMLVKASQAALSAQAGFPWFMAPYNLRGPDLFGLDILFKTESAVEGVLAQADAVLQRIAEKGITAEELDAVKAHAEFEWHGGMQFLLERANRLAAYTAFIGHPKGMAQDLKRLLSITPEDVRAAAQRLLAGGRAVIHVVPAQPGPAAPEPPNPAVPDAAPRAPGDQPPGPDAMKPTAPPALRRFTLSNGLKVVVARDARFPLLQARLFVKAGRTSEAAGQEGLSTAASDLLLKGTADQDGAAVSKAFSRLGWSVGTTAGSELFYVEAAGLARNAPAFFGQLGKVLVQASFPADEVGLWRKNSLEELKVLRSRPDFLTGERMRQEVFPGHPYSRGTPDERALEAVTPEGLRSFYASKVVPSNGTLILVGDVDPGQAEAMLEAALAGWRGASADVSLPALPDHGAARWVIVDRPGSQQANLSLAQTVPLTPKDPDYLAFSVMNQILGGSSTSRLFVNLRVQHGYTYGSYSQASSLSRGTLWAATAETRNNVALPALQEMMKEIKRLRDEPVDPATLDRAKRYLEGIFLIRLSAMDRTAGLLQKMEVDGLDPVAEMKTYVARLNALTASDIQRVAKTYLDPERIVGVVVGDKQALEPVLAPAAPHAGR